MEKKYSTHWKNRGTVGKKGNPAFVQAQGEY